MLARVADLVVDAGMNLQSGQVVAISSEPGKEAMTRAIADAAYRRGAKYVDLMVFDLHVKHARDEDLDWVPPWLGERLLKLGEMRAARVALTGPVAPGLFEGLDPVRLGRDQLPFVREAVQLINDGTTNWTAVPCPTPAWAQLVYGDLEPAQALAALDADLHRILRLDEPDPSAAWRARAQELAARAAILNEQRFTGLRFRGPGTDLHVGLLGGSVWEGGLLETVDGIAHVPNLPTEEVFTAPDPERVDGHVTSTKPLVIGGTTVKGLQVRFEGGRAVDIQADAGGDVLAALCKRDDGASRLGEVAIVDRASRVGEAGTVFYDTLLDENSASHVALGGAYPTTAEGEDRERINSSEIHIDFMIGSPEVDVDGVRADGTEVPILRAGAWSLL